MTTLSKMISPGALLVAIAAAAFPASAEPTAKSVCVTRNADAAMRSVIPVDLPPLASLAGISGSATVQVDLDERGIARNPAIVTSSGSALLDDAARKAALTQTYSPQIRDCQNVGGSYRVVIDFTHDGGH